MRRGRKSEGARNLRLFEQLLREGRTRGRDAIERAGELLREYNVSSARIQRIITDGRRRHREGWKPPKAEYPYYLCRRSRLDEKLKRYVKEASLYLMVLQVLPKEKSLRRACRSVHRQLGKPPRLTEVQILESFQKFAQFFPEEKQRKHRKQTAKVKPSDWRSFCAARF